MSAEQLNHKVLTIGRFDLIFPTDHLSDQHRLNYKLYDWILGEIARLVIAKYPDATAIDIGANVGDTAAVLCRHQDMPVLCIEGHPTFLRFLHANMGRLPGTVEIEECLLGATPGVIPLHALADAGGTARLVSVTDRPPSEEAFLRVKTLGDALAAHPRFSAPKLIKFDTDGADFGILASSMNIIAQSGPALFFEYSLAERKTSLQESHATIAALTRCGYNRFFVYDNFGNLLDVVTRDFEQKFADLNRFIMSNILFGRAVYYFDVCAFMERDADLADNLYRYQSQLVDENCRRNGWEPQVSTAPGAAGKPPIIIAKQHGQAGDALDTLRLWEAFENPQRWEETLKRAFEDSKNDADLAAVLKAAYLQEGIAEAFESFHGSRIPRAMANLLGRFGIGPDAYIADVGCGRGHAAHALHRLGFKNVTAMDPNGEWYSGTGYLKSVADKQISIVNDLDVWRSLSSRFDAIITYGTIHHWQHIPLFALDARRTLKPGAFWFSFSEPCANSSKDLIQELKYHPTGSRYNSYEWTYPASAYVDLIQSVGFNLVAVIPHFYHRNEFIGWTLPIPQGLDPARLSARVDERLASPHGTVEMFWEEVDAFRRGATRARLFTLPQALVFQRVEPE